MGSFANALWRGVVDDFDEFSVWENTLQTLLDGVEGYVVFLHGGQGHFISCVKIQKKWSLSIT